MTDEKELEEYIHRNIPIAKFMGLGIETAPMAEIVIKAPIENNINHKRTVFGGSLHAVATLSCWSLIFQHLKNLGHFEIVIAQSEIKYIAPVTSDFKARCFKPEKELWNKFLSALKSKRKARILLSSTIHQNDALAVEFRGTFAAIEKV